MCWDDLGIQNRKTLWRFAEELALAAAEKTLEYFGKEISVEWKEDESPVTQADRETELLMREIIKSEYPDHAVHGEEFGSDEYRDFTWILDPIDGTKSFINGVPLYCTLVSLMYKGEPVIGVVVNPPSGELVSGCIGVGARDETGGPLRLAEPRSPLRIYVSDFTSLQFEAPPWYPKLLEQGQVIARTWGDGYGYLLLVSGRGDIMIDFGLEVWDVAPLYPILHEAGAVLCNHAGLEEKMPSYAAAMSRTLYKRLFDLTV